MKFSNKKGGHRLLKASSLTSKTLDENRFNGTLALIATYTRHVWYEYGSWNSTVRGYINAQKLAK